MVDRFTERGPVVVGEPDPDYYARARHGSPDEERRFVDKVVRDAQNFILTSGQPVGRIGPPEEALDAHQAADYADDEHYRRDLVAASGGEVSVFEGILISEAEDPYVQAWIDEFDLRTEAKHALAAQRAYNASWAIRWAHQTYRDRLWLQERWVAFREWLER